MSGASLQSIPEPPPPAEEHPLPPHADWPCAVVDLGHRKVLHHDAGVYFGLPDDNYFCDPALGSSDIKNLKISAPDYWHASLYNPARDNDSTRYTERGHGLHSCLLFGEEHFRKQFARKLQKDEHKDALITIDDIKRELRARGLSISGTKAEVAKRLRDAVPRVKIFDDLVEFQTKGGKTVLTAEDYDRILIADQMVRRNPKLENVFRNGVPEVAIFWEQDGVRFRSKLDYLAPRATVDLKSFSNSLRRPVDRAIDMIFWSDRHDLQASLYLTARAQMRRFVEEGRVFGEIDMDWLRKAAAVDDDVFVFLYHQLSGAVVTRAKFIRRGGHVDGATSVHVAEAANIWRENWKLFGPGLWVDMSDITEITEEDVPGWLRW